MSTTRMGFSYNFRGRRMPARWWNDYSGAAWVSSWWRCSVVAMTAGRRAFVTSEDAVQRPVVTMADRFRAFLTSEGAVLRPLVTMADRLWAFVTSEDADLRPVGTMADCIR